MAEKRLELRRLASDELTAAQVARLRDLLWDAFADHDDGAMTENDWQHALGGAHFILEENGVIVSHAAVVTRELHVAGLPLRTAYVEAVATDPPRQGQGLGTRVMRAVGDLIDAGNWQLAALATSSHGFYERLGWRTWRGPSSVRTAAGQVATPDEDGYIMVRATPHSPALDWHAPISCEWRAGDVW